MKNGLLIFSAPSGSGKSTIVNWLMKEHPELKLAFSISCTSRAPRGTEQNGVEYFFLSPEEFKAKIEADEFLEYEEVYQDRFYGTLKSQVENQLANGESVIFDVDVKGGVNIKKFYGERALSIFVQPPSVEELRRRLVGRNTDAPEVIEQRLANHLKYFRETMNEEGHAVGKKLGFIAQEMGREINTTGSKSNQAEMQNIVVKMKDELEQIKEQVLNAL